MKGDKYIDEGFQWWQLLTVAGFLLFVNARPIAERVEAWLSDSVDGIDWGFGDDR